MNGSVGCCVIGTGITSGVGWGLWGQDWETGMVNGVRWVLWGRDWGELGSPMGLVGCYGVRTGGLGGLGWSIGSDGCCGVETGGIGIPNGIRWVLWGQDWGDWDGQ